MEKELTQAELAYKELGHRILIREIFPNERIKEEQWAKRFGVSRSAIRESLTRLLGEGILRAGPKGGFFVIETNVKDIRELRELREILESAAFVLACERATPQQIKEIEETCGDFSMFVGKKYFTGANEADIRFHQLIVGASGNTRLQTAYQRSHIPLFLRKKTSAQGDIADYHQTEREHRQILDALKRRDKQGGISVLRAHLDRGESAALADAE